MTATIDLHVHTTASDDGELSPAAVVEAAAGAGLAALAFADHDTTDAVEEGLALAPARGVDFLPGVELSCGIDGRDVHVLGYLLDWRDAALLAACAATRRARVDQAAGRVALLRKLGFDVELGRVMEIAGQKPPTAAVIMKALRESNARRADARLMPYIHGHRADAPALNFYLDWHAPGRAAFAPMEALDARRAVELIHGARGLAVVAHPGRVAREAIDRLLDKVDGIEVYSSNHTVADEEFYSGVARERGLLVTAGSDFHGPGRKTASLGGLRAGDTGMIAALRERHKRLFGG